MCLNKKCMRSKAIHTFGNSHHMSAGYQVSCGEGAGASHVATVQPEDNSVPTILARTDIPHHVNVVPA